MDSIAIIGYILAGVVLGYVIGYMANPLVSMYRQTITQLKADNKSLRMELDKVYFHREEIPDTKQDLTDIIPDEVIEKFLEKTGINMSVEDAKSLIPTLMTLKKHL